MNAPTVSSTRISSWPSQAALLTFMLLIIVFSALLAYQYSRHQQDLIELYQSQHATQIDLFQRQLKRYRQQTRDTLLALRAKLSQPDQQQALTNLQAWWLEYGTVQFSSVQWTDNNGSVIGQQGDAMVLQAHQEWFQKNHQDDKFHSGISCNSVGCFELTQLELSLQGQPLGQVYLARKLQAFFQELAQDRRQLALMHTRPKSGSQWKAEFFNVGTLAPSQLTPMSDVSFFRRVHDGQAPIADSSEQWLWSLLPFPPNYAETLYVVERSAPALLTLRYQQHTMMQGAAYAILSALLTLAVFLCGRTIRQRLITQTRLLPLLGQKQYPQLRAQLQHAGTSHWINEFNLIEDSLSSLSYQLESLENTVDIRNQEMERLSLFDSLTGLPNRHLLQYEIDNDLKQLHQHNHEGIVAVMLLDLDKFKRINDSLGHQIGDAVLDKMAKRLKGSIRSLGLVARLGGDEFAILLRKVKRPEQLNALSQKVLELVRRPVETNDTTLVISCSIGISIATADDTANDLLKHAEIAMYKGKETGGNDSRLFNAQMAAEIHNNLSLESEIRRALGDQEFTLYLQPKVSMDGIIKGFESLVRWDHPDRGILPPGEFIPAMESMGLISELDNWVLEASCRQLKVLEPHYPNITIAVNISSTHFTDQSFLSFLQSCLRKYPIDPCKLELEITETLLMENMSSGREVIDKIKQLGVRIAIDDFGTGYSSLSYLKKLPVDTLKIDREFIKDIPDSESDMQISSVIIFLAKQLHFSVVAEGVETSEQLVFLKASQCDLAQGFLFSKPIAAHKAILMLESERIDLSQRTG